MKGPAHEKRFVWAFGTTLLFVAPAGAQAQAQAPAQRGNDAAAAEALFNDGKRSMEAGQYDVACPKFAESQRLDPGVGTMLWLGECNAKNGRIATGWATFKEAEALAAKQNDKRTSLAREEADKLEPRLSKLVIDVPPTSDVAGLVVTRDGVVLGKPLWRTAIPTDAGVHHIAARAPNHRSWTADVTVPSEGGSVSIRIPTLAIAPQAELSPTPAVGRTQRFVGLGVAGLGVAGAIVGTVFGLRVKSKLDDSRANCVGNQCNQSGVNDRNDALSAATAANVLFVLSGVAIAGGAVLYFTAPKTAPSVSVGAGPLADGAAAVVHGVFE